MGLDLSDFLTIFTENVIFEKDQVTQLKQIYNTLKLAINSSYGLILITDRSDQTFYPILLEGFQDSPETKSIISSFFSEKYLPPYNPLKITETRNKDLEKLDKCLESVHSRINEIIIIYLNYNHKQVALITLCNISGGFSQKDREIAEQISTLASHIISENVLQEEMAISNLLLDVSDDFVALLDIEGHILGFNSLVAKILSAENKEDLLGKNLFDLFPPNFADFRKKKFHEVLIRKVPVSFSEAKDGKYFFTKIDPILDENGNVKMIGILAKDLTAEKKTENEREILIKNLDEIREKIGLPNQIFNLSSENSDPIDNILNRIVNLLPKVWHFPEIASARIIFRGKKYVSSNFNQDQPERWIQSSNIDVGGKIVGRVDVIYSEDRPLVDDGPFFSDEKAFLDTISGLIEKIVSELQDSVNLYRIIFDNSPYAILITDKEGIIHIHNRVTKRIFGFEEIDDLPQNITSLFWKEEERVIILDKILNNKYVSNERIKMKKKDGSAVYINLESVLLTLSGNNLILSLVSDITENVRLEDELSRKEKLAVLGTMTGLISHELRNPLFVVQALVDLLAIKIEKRDSEIFSLVRTDFDRINDELRAMTRMVSDQLSFFSAKSKKLEEMNIYYTIQNIVEKLPHRNGIDIIMNVSDDLKLLTMPKDKISHILLNLLVNAVQSMPEGGTITISSEFRDDSLFLIIEDTGSGISPEESERIFEPLFTTKTKGIGLGLSVVKNLIEANNGTIRFASELGKGTTFTFSIPAKKVD